MRRSTRGPGLLAGLVTVALLLTGCAGADAVDDVPDEPVAGGVLQYGTDVQPVAGGIDPYVAASFAAQNVYVQIYESLLTKDDDGTIQPGLAQSWDEVDPTTYRFTLRDDATFSDGTPLTVEDVIFSFDTMKESGAAQASMLTALESVEAVDDRTVEFRLSTPSGAFLNLVAGEGTGVIVSKDWYTSTPPEERQRTALGTGPFRLTAWQDNVVLSLRRNPHYWDAPHPYLDGIDFRIIPDDQARLAALRQGTVDAIWIGDQQLSEQVEQEGFQVGQNAKTRDLTIYVDTTSGPLASTEVRQALSTGLDRDQLAKLASYGYGEPSLVVPVGDPASVGPDADTPHYTHDLATARELLAASGVEDPTVTLTYPSDAAFARDVALYEVMQEQLKDVGITLRLNPTPWADILASYVSGSYTGLTVVPGTAQPDPSGYFAPFLAPTPMNKTGGAGESASALFGQYVATADPDARSAVLEQLEDEVADQVLVLVPYVVAQRQEIWSPRLQDYDVDPYSFRKHLEEAWLVP
ncbi:ABC transporter substrate-binding protein [Isoptericola sp. NPDC019482]|uniref:ABC transporter substrate-binding protein n=1 Tax=Isoptericola sp. NPDC019482 TaxID=3154688 RepID=UPI003487CA96